MADKFEEISKIKLEADAENNKLRQEVLQSAEEYARKIEALEKLHEDKIQQLHNNKEKLLKVNIY